VSEVRPPRRRLGRYELIAEIASGGMGMVCLGRLGGAGGFQRLFAVKVMHPHLLEDAQFVGMLLDEARLAARIHHPNVVATVDICTQDRLYYLVMDYVDGFQLLDVLDHPGLGTEERTRIVIRALIDAMMGLEAAHTLRTDDGEPIDLVHRDVSPQNILVGIDGISRLTDFGIALAASRISASRPGMIKGKPAYMAPEQARASRVDRRADLWAVGVILWEALTGRRLFVADTEAGVVMKVIEAPISTARAFSPNVSPELDEVCLRALDRDPAKRFSSARAMASALERAAAHAGLLADSHEVADRVRQLFSQEIDHRRRAIRAHAASIDPNGGQMLASDVYELPRLNERLPPGGDYSASPLPSASPAIDVTFPSATPVVAQARQSAQGPTATELSAEVARKPRRNTGALVGLLALLLVAGGAVAAYAKFGSSLASGGNDGDAGPATGAGSDAPRDGSGTSTELAAEPPTPRVEPSLEPEAVPLVEALGSATASTTATLPPQPPRQRPPAGRPPKAPPKSEPTAPSPPDKAPVDSKTPVFEENPYRQR
jgi:serine/threonine protein kinase